MKLSKTEGSIRRVGKKATGLQGQSEIIIGAGAGSARQHRGQTAIHKDFDKGDGVSWEGQKVIDTPNHAEELQ